MSDLIRQSNLLGSVKTIVGDSKADLVLESLGKIYIKTGKNSKLLNDVFSLMDRYKEMSDKELYNCVILTNNLESLEYPGDGTLILETDLKALYIAYLGLYLLIANAEDALNNGYVKRSGDTMTGLLIIKTRKAPLIVTSRRLAENLNAEFINGLSKDEIAVKALNEFITGKWTFQNDVIIDGVATVKGNILARKDIVLSGSIGTPEFASGYNGYGWRLESSTNMLTVDYLVVRKAMHVFELVINRITATNGSLWVTDSGKIEDVHDIIMLNVDTYKDPLIVDLWYLPFRNLNSFISSVITGEHLCDSLGLGKDKQFYNFLYIFKVFNAENIQNILKDNPEILLNIDNLKSIDGVVVKSLFEKYDFYNIDTTPKYYVVPNDIKYINSKNDIHEIYTFYKYFGLNIIKFEENFLELPDIHIIDLEDDKIPSFDEGDIIRCLKFKDGNLKYYDALIGNRVGEYSYILITADSVFDKYTEIHYHDDGSMDFNEEYNYTQYIKNLDNIDIIPPEYNTEDLRIQYLKEHPLLFKNLMFESVSKEDEIVRIGNLINTQRLNSVYITSSEFDSPFISVLNGVNRPDYSVIYKEPYWDTYQKPINGSIIKGYYYKSYDISNPYYFELENESGTKLGYLLTKSVNKDCVIKSKKIKLLDGTETTVNRCVYKNAVRTRLGNLQGIQNENFKDKQPCGYGLYGESVYLTGEFILNNGMSVVEFTENKFLIAVGQIEEILEILKIIQDNVNTTTGSSKDIKNKWINSLKIFKEVGKDGIVSKKELIKFLLELNLIDKIDIALSLFKVELENIKVELQKLLDAATDEAIKELLQKLIDDIDLNINFYFGDFPYTDYPEKPNSRNTYRNTIIKYINEEITEINIDNFMNILDSNYTMDVNFALFYEDVTGISEEEINKLIQEALDKKLKAEELMKIITSDGRISKLEAKSLENELYSLRADYIYISSKKYLIPDSIYWEIYDKNYVLYKDELIKLTNPANYDESGYYVGTHDLNNISNDYYLARIDIINTLKNIEKNDHDNINNLNSAGLKAVGNQLIIWGNRVKICTTEEDFLNDIGTALFSEGKISAQFIDVDRIEVKQLIGKSVQTIIENPTFEKLEMQGSDGAWYEVVGLPHIESGGLVLSYNSYDSERKIFTVGSAYVKSSTTPTKYYNFQISGKNWDNEVSASKEVTLPEKMDLIPTDVLIIEARKPISLDTPGPTIPIRSTFGGIKTKLEVPTVKINALGQGEYILYWPDSSIMNCKIFKFDDTDTMINGCIEFFFKKGGVFEKDLRKGYKFILSAKSDFIIKQFDYFASAEKNNISFTESKYTFNTYMTPDYKEWNSTLSKSFTNDIEVFNYIKKYADFYVHRDDLLYGVSENLYLDFVYNLGEKMRFDGSKYSYYTCQGINAKLYVSSTTYIDMNGFVCKRDYTNTFVDRIGKDNYKSDNKVTLDNSLLENGIYIISYYYDKNPPKAPTKPGESTEVEPPRGRFDCRMTISLLVDGRWKDSCNFVVTNGKYDGYKTVDSDSSIVLNL